MNDTVYSWCFIAVRRLLYSMASSSAVLRRRIFGSLAAGIIGSRRIPAAYRMIASTSGVESPPWLMMQPSSDGSIFRFYSLAKNEIHNFFNGAYGRRSVIENYFEFVGSSNGWLGLYSPDSHVVVLSDPLRDRLVELPAIDGAVHRLIVGENGRLAVVVEGGGGRVAFCSPSSSCAWTPLASASESACDSLAYSSRHHRLFCITRDAGNNTNLEAWELGEEEAPMLVWKIGFDIDSRSPEVKTLKYIVCAEHSGELFVVARHVRIREGTGGSFVEGGLYTKYEGPDVRDPFRTYNFEVYRVDRERGRLILMEESLEGMAMFVGTSQALAIPATGLRPDSVYFTYDRHIRFKSRSRSNWYRYGGGDNGGFDYIKRDFFPLCASNLIVDLYKPLWFGS